MERDVQQELRRKLVSLGYGGEGVQRYGGSPEAIMETVRGEQTRAVAPRTPVTFEPPYVLKSPEQYARQ